MSSPTPAPPRSSTSPSTSDAHRVADVLYRSLEMVFPARCAERYGTEVTINRTRDSTSTDTHLTEVSVKCSDLIQMSVRFTVSHAGGNVYDVRCAVEDGPTHRFTYSLPSSAAMSFLREPGLNQELANFLFGELECRLGRRLLRGQEL